MKKLITIVVFGFMVIVSCKPLTGVQYHNKLQKEMSYEEAIKRNTAFSLKNAKDALKQAKKDQRISEKLAKEFAKRQAIWDEINEMKNKGSNN